LFSFRKTVGFSKSEAYEEDNLSKIRFRQNYPAFFDTFL